MSAFLGPIHTWLFHKIKFQDDLTTAIMDAAVKNGYSEELKSQADRRYGALEQGELADIIDENNIHGWLQERISVVENRLAFVVTVLLEDNADNSLMIEEVAKRFGKNHALSPEISAKEVYAYLENCLLNGMPCDRVNLVVSESEESVVWEQTQEIHAAYWSMIQGNVENYYKIREAFIQGMLEDTNVSFESVGNQRFELRSGLCTE